jgi:hypothetical protein
MITQKAFFEYFTVYNSTWLPVLVIFWIGLVICTYILFRRTNETINAVMKMWLAFIFAWNGIVFFFLHMKPSAIVGGVPMIAVAIVFLMDVFRNTITFRLPEKRWHRCITLCLIVWSLGLYTVTGWLTGHPHPSGPTPLAPCPMTIFTIALITTSMHSLNTSRWIFSLLFMFLFWWSLFAGLSAPLFFGFYVDFTLFFTGAYGLVMVVRHWGSKG